MAEKTFEIIGFGILALVGVLIFMYWVYGPEGIAQYLGFDPFEPLRKLFKQFFGGAKEMLEYQQAKYSVKAMWCAILATSKGNVNEPCLNEFREELKYGFKIGDMEKKVRTIKAASERDAEIKCKEMCKGKMGCKAEIIGIEKTKKFKCIIRWSKLKTSPSGMFNLPTLDIEHGIGEEFVGATNIKCEELGGFITVDFIEAENEVEGREKCEELFGEKARAYSYSKGVFKCSVPKVSCTIEDFILPQRVSKAEEYIAHYGDPMYLMYWEEFPKEWDTWTFIPDWKWHLLAAIIAIIPFERAISAGGKLMLKAGLRVGGKKTKDAIKNALRQMFSEATAKKLAKYPVKHPIRVAGKFIAAEGALKVIDIIESIEGKYNPIGNSIVLKIPYFDPENFELIKGWEGKPVTVKWDPGLFGKEKLTPFHLVSPCKMHELDVKLLSVKCSKYSHNWKEKTTKCTYKDMKEWGWGIKEVSTIDKSQMCNLKYFADLDPEKLDRTNIIDFVDELLKNKVEVHKLDIKDINSNDLSLVPVKLTQTPTEDEAKGMIIEINIGERIVHLADEDDDMFFDTFTIFGCQTPAVEVWADIGRMDKYYENNYCLHRKYEYITKPMEIMKKVASYLGMSIGGVMAVFGGATCFFTGVGCIISAAGVTIFTYSGISASVLRAVEAVAFEYPGTWP